MSEFERLHEQGFAERGDILGDVWERGPVEPFLPPRHEGQPEFPTPGIFFGMPEADYHAIPSCSTSTIKNLSVSSMDCWANSTMNLDREEVRKDYFDFGHAIHTLVLEGEEAYAARYAIGLDRADYPDALETTVEIKTRIAELGHKPATKVGEGIARPARKEDWIEQLLDIEPEAQVWDVIQQDWLAEHEGRETITAKIDRRVRIAAKMILAHPDIGPLFTGGQPEVSVFWFCPRTGAPMKARFDYLKARAVIDLKSFGNRSGMPIDRAVIRAISNNRYNIQHDVYLDAVSAAKAMILADKGNVHGDDDMVDWCSRWAENAAPDFVFVFQQTGIAPVTRAVVMPTGNAGSIYDVTHRRVDELKARWVELARTYGTDPWLDIQPITYLADEEIPEWTADI